MQHLEVSGAVRPMYIYVVRQLRVKFLLRAYALRSVSEQVTGNICVPDVAVSYNVLETVNSGMFVCNLDLPNMYYRKYLLFSL